MRSKVEPLGGAHYPRQTPRGREVVNIIVMPRYLLEVSFQDYAECAEGPCPTSDRRSVSRELDDLNLQ